MPVQPTVTVICSVEPLPWHNNLDRATTPANRFGLAFGLNVSAAYYQQPGNGDHNVLLPWNWFLGKQAPAILAPRS